MTYISSIARAISLSLSAWTTILLYRYIIIEPNTSAEIGTVICLAVMLYAYFLWSEDD